MCAKFLIGLCLSMVLIFPASARMGDDGWISSGGEIFLYARNPWFVRNVTTVNYCVAIDMATISASEATVRQSVRQAFDYWKNEMNLAMPMPDKGYAQLATQNFVEQSVCDDDADIQFKFGYGTLTKKEIENLEDPTVYVGVTVRTSYDLKTLKAKGFVYISSDKGPKAYKNSGELVTEAWQEPRLLLYSLIHETGHIMGIPHTGSGIMSEIFLNQVLHKSFSRFYVNNPLQPFLLEPRTFEVCNMSGNFNANFFLVPKDTACMKFEAIDVAAENWKVYASAQKASPYTQIGFVRLTGANFSDLAAKPSVIVQLPPGQTVFGLMDRRLNTFMIGPLFKSRNVQGHFETMTSHRPYPLQIQLAPDAVSFTGVADGRMGLVLVYAQPSLLNMLLPIK